MMIKEKFGYLLIFISVLVTGIFWILAKDSPSFLVENPRRALSQIISLESFILLSISLLLATKSKILDRLFNGLDKVYKVHKFTGIVAFVFLVNHPILLILNKLNKPETALSYFIPKSTSPFDLGILSLYCFVLGFIFMVFIKLPYHHWKIIHKLTGFGFILGGLHTFTINSDVKNFLPLEIWTGIFFAIGIGGFIYSTFLYNLFGPKFKYKIINIERSLDIINLYFQTCGKKMVYSPGQFVYISLKNKSLGRELHPFSISSAPEEEFLRLSIKITGDYTLKLPELKIGDEASIYGPYGNFGQNTGSSSQIWIGGGIGIAPFLSMARHYIFHQPKIKTKLIYCCKNASEACFASELDFLVSKMPSFNITKWFSVIQGRINAKTILENIPDENPKIYLCGPAPMMEALKKQFLKLGVKDSQIHYESFQII